MIPKRYGFILLLLAALVVLSSANILAQENIEQLIEQLGDDDIEVRDKAQGELEKIGKPAVEALEKAARDEDPERRARAQSILNTLRNVARRTVTEKDKFGNPVKETDYNALDEKLKVTEFGPDGKPVKETEYKNSKPVKMTEYHPNGKPKKVTEYKDGKPFKFTEFDKEGKPKPQEMASTSSKSDEIKVKTEKASGVQTGILESTLKGQVIAKIDLPDTVYAGQPFTGSMQMPETEEVAKAEKMGWVEIQQKKYPIREGSFTVPTVAATALGIGGLIALIKNADGEEIGRMPVPVKKAPDMNSIPTKIPEIVQNGPAIIRDKNIDGIPNTICNMAGRDLRVRAEVPGKSVVEIPEDLKPGQHPFRFADGETDISGEMTKCDVDIKGPETMTTGERRTFQAICRGLKDWDLKNKPLEITIRSEGSVKVGKTGEITDTIAGVDRKGNAVVPFQAQAGPIGPYEITASIHRLPALPISPGREELPDFYLAEGFDTQDPWEVQKEGIKTVDEFKEWIKKLKEAIDKKVKDGGMKQNEANDLKGRLDDCAGIEKYGTDDGLEAKKHCADDVLRGPKIVRTAAALWVDGFDLYRYYISGILSMLEEPKIPWKLINKCIDFMIKGSEKVGDKEGTQTMKDLKKLKEKVEKGKEAIDKLKEALEELKDYKPEPPEK